MSQFSISQPLRQVQSETLHVGVDLALEKNMVVVINEKAKQLDRFSFPQDRGGYDYFLRRVEGLRQKHAASGIAVAMEPTNYFWKLLARELEEKKISYHLVNAYTVKKHREGNQLDPSKDDPRDAGQIAELSRTGHYTETRLQKGVYEELRQYATLHGQLIQGVQRELQILWGLAGQVFPELSEAFKDLDGATSRALLVSCACAADIRQMSEDDFIVKVRTAYTGKKLHVSKVQRAYQLAATSIGLTEGIQAIQLAIQLHFTHLQTLQAQLGQITKAMTACLVSLPEAPYLLSIKSLKPMTVALFLAEVGDPRRYRTAAQWVKLAGIQPVPNASGKKQRSKTPMSHHGRARLRTLLYFTCLRMVQQDPHFAQIYSDLQRRPKNPLTKMQALGVLMNKLLHILWALAQNQTLYNPSFAQSI
ncbi:MAG TPA: IS110 family transposase [Anaerolineales bacterium]|nr:IS110 family transposase [Anaerolineales bacterium]